MANRPPRHEPDTRRALFEFVKKHHGEQRDRHPSGASRVRHLVAVARQTRDMLWLKYGNSYGFCLTPANETLMLQGYAAALLHESISGAGAVFDDIAHMLDYNTALVVADLTPDCRQQGDRMIELFAGQISEAGFIAQTVKLADICQELRTAQYDFEIDSDAARTFWEDRLNGLDRHHQALRRLRHDDSTEVAWHWAKTTIQELFAICSKLAQTAGIKANIAKRKAKEAQEERERLKKAAEDFAKHGK
jgi:hypothetical protein